MSTLLLKLFGPLQAWGTESRFTERKTGHEPSKSGVVGLLASALGRRRTDSVEDLSELTMAVRVDQAGSYLRDFQTAHTRKFDAKAGAWVFDKSLPLSNRLYLADALFMVALEGPDDFLGRCADALDHPAFPLFLGRRSCPPADRVFAGLSDSMGVLQMLESHPWEASKAYFRRIRYAGGEDLATQQRVRLDVLRDQLPEDGDQFVTSSVRDVPVSFSQEQRLFRRRVLVRDAVLVQNPHALQPTTDHDPFAAL